MEGKPLLAQYCSISLTEVRLSPIKREGHGERTESGVGLQE